MPAPAWFFSTLAQAIAAAIGFVIAFTASYYTSRKQRISGKTDALIEDLRDLDERYRRVVQEISRNLLQQGNFNPSSDVTELNVDQEEIGEWAQEQRDTSTAYLWANLTRVADILAKFQTRSPNEKTREQLVQLNTTLKTLSDEHAVNENIYTEIENTESYPDDYHVQTILDNTAEMEQFLKEEIPDSSNVNPELAGSIFAIGKVIENLRSEGVQIGSRAGGTELHWDYQPTQIVVRKSRNLFIVGVIAPLIFLLTPPSWFTVSAIVPYYGLVRILIQILILILTGWFSLQLLTAIETLIRQDAI